MNNNLFSNSSFNDQFSYRLDLGLGNSGLSRSDISLGNLSGSNSLFSTRDTRGDTPPMPGAQVGTVYSMPLSHNPGVRLDMSKSPVGASLNADMGSLQTAVGGYGHKNGFDASAGATYEFVKHHHVHGGVRGGFTRDGERVSQGISRGYYHDLSPNTQAGVRVDRDMAKASANPRPTNTFSFWSLFKI